MRLITLTGRSAELQRTEDKVMNDINVSSQQSEATPNILSTALIDHLIA